MPSLLCDAAANGENSTLNHLLQQVSIHVSTELYTTLCACASVNKCVCVCVCE